MILDKNKMKIDGVVVLYNPSDEVLNSINTYLSFLNKLFVIDNSEKYNKNLIDKLVKIPNVEYINLNENKGIAYALKVGVERAIKDVCSYCLTMDQDSYFPTKKINDVINYLYENEKTHDFGIIGLNYNSSDTKRELVEVKTIISSGNFIDLYNYSLIKGFNPELFIDYVDFDLNEQFYSIGKKIGYIRNVSLKHTIGKPIIKKFLWKNIICTNDTPIRYYYRYRNGLYLYKKNKKFYKELYRKENLKDIIKLLLFVKDKKIKLKMIALGKSDAKKGILGKYRY